MKIFGKELFNFKKEEQKLWDFNQFGDSEGPISLMDYAVTTTAGDPGAKKLKKEPKPINPKKLFKAGSLNNNNFKINADSAYIDAQVHFIDEKLGLYPKVKARKNRWGEEYTDESGAVKHGREELKSIKERLLNRKRIDEFKDVVAKYPHTSTSLISEVINDHKDLSLRRHDQFIPEYPTAAVKAMKEYDAMCVKLCGKKTNFYVIANNKDFQKANSRRDPILLAQSPFGFFWQILGAWDDEMVYLGDL